MDIKELSKKYNRAKAYADGLKTPFFKQLKEKLEDEIDLVMKIAVLPGLDNEHDAIVEARAKKKLLLFLEDQEKVAERLKKQLEK
jgi:hypothetical protein